VTTMAERALNVTLPPEWVTSGAALGGVRFGKRERHLLTFADYMDRPLALGPDMEAKLDALAGQIGGGQGQRGHYASDITAEVLCKKYGSDDLGGPKLDYWTLRAAEKTDMRATRRALRKLERLGLVELLYSEPRWPSRRRLLMYDLTSLGRLVVNTYRAELESGKRIRWAKLTANEKPPGRAASTPSLESESESAR